MTRSGRLALVCDECDSTWFDRNGVSPENAQSPYPRGWAPPDRSTLGRRFVARLRAWGLIPTRGPGPFVFPDGDALDRPATASEIRDGGWGDLVPAES